MRPIDQAWTAYSLKVLRDGDHDLECTMNRRPEPDANDGGHERWPGYVGEAYEIGGVVCGGKVHTRFASAGLAGRDDLVTAAVAATRAFVDGDLEPEEWLQATRRLYRTGLAPGGWRVGTHVRNALERLGETSDTVAWINAARCQWAGSAPAGFARPCLRRFGWDEVLDVLQPRLVITSEDGVADQIGSRCPVLLFHQLNGLSRRELRIEGGAVLPVGTRSADWAGWLVGAGFGR